MAHPKRAHVHFLPASDIEHDEHCWFEKDRVLSFGGRFVAGTERLHYHPSNLRKYAGAGLAFASFVSRLAVIADVGDKFLRGGSAAIKSPSNICNLENAVLALTATKTGFSVTRDWKEFLRYLDDSVTYPEEGYYNIATKKLRVRGSIPSTGYLYYREQD